MNFGEVRRAQLATSTLLTSTLVPQGSPLRSFKVFSDAKERVGCGKQRVATAAIQVLVPEFVAEMQPWYLGLQ